MAEQVLFAGITTDIYSVYIEKDQTCLRMHNLTAFAHMRENRNSKKPVWTLYVILLFHPHAVITSPNLKSMSIASYLFCVNYLTTSFHQPHRYPLKIYIPTELSPENPAQYVCMVITQTLASTVVFSWNFT